MFEDCRCGVKKMRTKNRIGIAIGDLADVSSYQGWAGYPDILSYPARYPII